MAKHFSLLIFAAVLAAVAAQANYYQPYGSDGSCEMKIVLGGGSNCCNCACGAPQGGDSGDSNHGSPTAAPPPDYWQWQQGTSEQPDYWQWQGTSEQPDYWQWQGTSEQPDYWQWQGTSEQPDYWQWQGTSEQPDYWQWQQGTSDKPDYWQWQGTSEQPDYWQWQGTSEQPDYWQWQGNSNQTDYWQWQGTSDNPHHVAPVTDDPRLNEGGGTLSSGNDFCTHNYGCISCGTTNSTRCDLGDGDAARDQCFHSWSSVRYLMQNCQYHPICARGCSIK